MSDSNVQILNPGNPLTQKIEFFVRSYLKCCMFTEDDMQAAYSAFKKLMDTVDTKVQQKSGRVFDTHLGFAAALLASKWRVRKDQLQIMLVTAEAYISQI